MAQGYDTGIAEHEIDREAEQRRREDLRTEREIVGEEEKADDDQQPGERFHRMQAMAARETRDDVVFGFRRHAWPNNPRGFHSNTAMVRA